MADEIIVAEDGVFRSLMARSFRDELFNETLENGFQGLIERYPQMIPGSQIAPGSDDPPRFAMLCREMPVGSWSLDFLLIDQYSVPTLVEAKLAENPESKRAVVGQILEYATNASEYWSNGRLLEKANSYWNSKGVSAEDLIWQLLDDDEADLDVFWERVEKNLANNKIRLIIASDEIRPELRKVIEFLNKETSTIEVLGLELKCYGEGSEFLVLVPTIIGQSQVVAEKKSTADKKILWDYQRLYDYYDSMEKRERADRLKCTLDWAKDHSVLIVEKKQYPSFSIKGNSGKRLMTFWHEGNVYCFLNVSYYDGGEEEVNNLVSELNKLKIFDYNPEGVKSGRTSPGALDELSKEEFEEFIRILEKYCCNIND